MKIGIIRERKNPPDFRVPLIPDHCAEVLTKYNNLQICVEPSPTRSYSDQEYNSVDIHLAESLNDCDVLMGVKEVPPNMLIPNKTYLFFSHTIKKQPANKLLLQEVIRKKIRLIDYECLKDEHGQRLIGFGRFAGIVGAYNAIRGWGLRTENYQLPPAHTCYDKNDLFSHFQNKNFGNTRILLTGGGKVGNGALETLHAAGFTQMDWKSFITEKNTAGPVFTQIEFPVYNKRKDGKAFTSDEFFSNPGDFESDFVRFMPYADIYIAGHFWSAGSPHFFTSDDLASPHNRIKLIADISCDIGGPIPSTIRSSTIASPFYGYNPHSQQESSPFDLTSITVMAVDNLPCELPRDASADFSQTLSSTIIPLIIQNTNHPILAKATIAENGKLTSYFRYLSDYISE